MWWIIISRKKGTGKSTLIKSFREILKLFQYPSVELPMNATEEAILGGIDIDYTIKTGIRFFQKGILSKADGGLLICVIMDEIRDKEREKK